MKIVITGQSIKIGQLLKKINLIQTGGQASFFLTENKVKVNGISPQGRGSKVKVGSTVSINNKLYEIVSE